MCVPQCDVHVCLKYIYCFKKENFLVGLTGSEEFLLENVENRKKDGETVHRVCDKQLKFTWEFDEEGRLEMFIYYVVHIHQFIIIKIFKALNKVVLKVFNNNFKVYSNWDAQQVFNRLQKCHLISQRFLRQRVWRRCRKGNIFSSSEW